MKHLFTTLFAATALAVATPAFAAPHGDSHGAEAHPNTPGHGADSHDGKGHADGSAGHVAGDHGEGHGDDHGGGEHHVMWSHDADGDGTPNWMDADFEDQGTFGTPAAKVAFHGINLALFLGVIVLFGRRPIMDALADRALGIRKELEDSHKVYDEAKVRNDELGARLDKIEAEITGMRAEAEAEAVKQEAKLVERAHNEAGRIAEAAQRSIRDEVQRARFALKRDAVALAVELAESSLKERMNGEHQQQLAREFLASLKEDNHV